MFLNNIVILFICGLIFSGCRKNDIINNGDLGAPIIPPTREEPYNSKFCLSYHDDEKGCLKNSHCRYLKHKSDKSKNRCLEESERKNRCQDIVVLVDHFCELIGISRAENECIIVNHTCYAKSDFNSAGFNSDGINIATGQRYDIFGFNMHGQYTKDYSYTMRDPLGYDASGLNERGFNRSGIHSITGLDRDARGFNAQGIHSNGSFRDNQGYNLNGMDVNGYNTNRVDTVGNHISGHRYTYLHDGYLPLSNGNIMSPHGVELPPTYSDRGMDQLGRLPSLPHGPLGADERYNIDGYNAAGVNYLGLTKADFDARGYDAILNLPIVNAYPHTLSILIAKFEASCYDLHLDNIVDGDGYHRLDESNIVELMQGYEGANDSSLREYLIYKTVKDKTEDEIKDIVKESLKKGIYFCEEFLFKGDLTKANTASWVTLTLNHNSNIIKDQLPQPDWKNYLDDWQQSHPIADVHQIIIDAITKVDGAGNKYILRDALYAQADDHVNYHTNIPQKESHVRYTLSVYGDGGNGKDYDKSRVYLYFLAKKISVDGIDDDNLKMVTGYFLHGGAHCHDAKRAAIENLFSVIADDIFPYISAATNILPRGNIAADIKSLLYLTKADYYHKWIYNTVSARGGDLLSGLSDKWNTYRQEVGMPLKENAHNMGGDWPTTNGIAPIQRFFMPFKILSQANYPEYYNSTYGYQEQSKVVLNGGFTKDVIYNHVYPRYTNIGAMRDIMAEIFGPLWVMVSEAYNNSEIRESATTKLPEHPIMNALLVRLGLLNLP